MCRWAATIALVAQKITHWALHQQSVGLNSNISAWRNEIEKNLGCGKTRWNVKRSEFINHMDNSNLYWHVRDKNTIFAVFLTSAIGADYKIRTSYKEQLNVCFEHVLTLAFTPPVRKVFRMLTSLSYELKRTTLKWCIRRA
jgi:hypothetical protein